MFIEAIDQLRCVNDHEDSWLVASFVERQDRFIIRGTLGCHICQREYPIARGIMYVGVVPGELHPTGAQAGDPVLGDSPLGDSALGDLPPGDPEMAMRVAAFLNAAERSTFVLAGEWGLHAHALAQIVPVRIFAVNVPSVMDDSELVALIESSEGIPLAKNSVDGVALDRATASSVNLASALAVLKPGGRLVAPAATPVPPEVNVLARDDHYWVGEMAKELISLRRGGAGG
jgi:hypothetical protein